MDLVTLLERSVHTRPNQLAVATATESLTYAELLSRARERAARHGEAGPRVLVARDAVDTAVNLVAAVIADHALLMVDPAAPGPEAERARARFGGDAEPAVPSGLGLSTSGVTGEPRCVVRPWPLVADNAAAFAEGLGLTHEDVVMTTSSMHHSYAVSAGLCGALAAGASFIAPGGMLPPSLLARHIDNHRVSVLLSVPMLYRWYTAGIPATHPPRLCVSAGAAMEEDIRSAWARSVGWPMVEHYGTSEMGQLSVAGPDDGGTVGRPIRGVRIRATRTNATGEHELEVSVDGPSAIMLESTDGTVTPRPLVGWVPTGDTGVVDSEGRVRITGRLGDTVNVGGKKVALREVESVLRSLTGVRDAAVVPYGDDLVVPKLYGFVEADAGFSELAAISALREQLSPHKVPRQIQRLASLPRTGSGKVRRRDLHLLAARHTASAPEQVASTTMTVPFDGPGAGVSPLTWGGRAIRRSIDWLGDEGHYFNDRHVLPLPEGATVDTVTTSLHTLVSRHQALRTYYPSVNGEIVMRVTGEDTLPLTVYSLPGGDARRLAEKVAEECGRPLFGREELPLRCAVIQSEGIPRFLVLVLSHQSIDAWTVDIILSELRQMWAGRGAELTQQPWQLLDQAADEATGESHRRGEASLRYWRAFYAAADPSMFDGAIRPPEPKPVQSVKMSSPCMELASRLIAARLGVSTSVALTGIIAAVLGHLTDHERITLLLISANRFDTRRRQLVAPLVEDVLCLVDLHDDLDTVIRDTARTTLVAYSNACYDPAAEMRVRRETELARGVCFDFHAAIINDVRLRGAPTSLDATSTAEDLDSLRTQTSFEPGHSWDRQNTKFFVRIIRSADTCLVELMADTRYLPVADIRQVLAAIESVAVGAATRNLALSDVAGHCASQPLPHGDAWFRHHLGWVDVSALTELLRRLSFCRAALAGIVTTNGAPVLTAYLVLRETPGEAAAPTPESVHHDVVAALRDSTIAIAPDRYVLCASQPDDDESVEAWASCEVIAAGDGRPRHPIDG